MDKMKLVIDECMENISMDENIKAKISEINADENSKNEKLKIQKSKNNKVTMRRIWKNAVSIAACLVLLFAVTSVGTYALSGKSIFEVFFENSEPSYAKELLDYNGQKYVIDDYTITLESTLFDRKTGLGYCVFSITKEGGKPEARLYGDVFGKDNRFAVRVKHSNGYSARFEYVGDTLYQYFSFSTSSPDFSLRVLDNKYENPNPTPDDIAWQMHYDFEIAETSKYKEYKVSDNRTISISPLGIYIEAFDGLGRTSVITLHYENGEEKTVVDTENEIGIGLSEGSYDGEKWAYRFHFKDIIDIQSVDYITYNGEKYEALN